MGEISTSTDLSKSPRQILSLRCVRPVGVGSSRESVATFVGRRAKSAVSVASVAFVNSVASVAVVASVASAASVASVESVALVASSHGGALRTAPRSLPSPRQVLRRAFQRTAEIARQDVSRDLSARFGRLASNVGSSVPVPSVLQSSAAGGSRKALHPVASLSPVRAAFGRLH